MTISKLTSFRFAVKDSPGVVSDFVVRFREAGADMEGMWGFSMGGGTGMVVVVAKDAGAFRAQVSSLKLAPEEITCFRLTAPDQKGALVETLGKIKAANINVEAVDSVAVGGQVACYIWCVKNDIDKLAKTLGV